MRRAGANRLFVSGLVLALVAVATPAAAFAQSAWKDKNGCKSSDIGMPGAQAFADIARMARECEALTSSNVFELAYAAYHSARAYNVLGDALVNTNTSSAALTAYKAAGLPGAGDAGALAAAAYDRANALVDKSLILFGPTHPDLTKKYNGDQKRGIDRFNFGRPYEKGRALVGQGKYVEAIAILSDQNRALALPLDAVPPRTYYDDFVLLRARAYTALKQDEQAKPNYMDLRARGRAHVQEASTALLAIYLKDADVYAKQPATLGSAIEAYRNALAIDGSSLPVRLGLGRIYLARAAQVTRTAAEKKQDYLDAVDVLKATTGVAAADNDRGEALLQLSFIDPNGGYLQQAISAYEAAVASDKNNPDRQLKLASALKRSNQFSKAQDALDAALRSMPASGAPTALAWIEMADVRSKLNGDVLTALQNAYRADSSARVNFEIGKYYFDHSEPARASGYLNDVITKTADAGVGGLGDAKYRGDAFYYLSIVGALGSSSASALDTAVANADKAAGVDPTNALYRNQQCLSRIQRGKDGVVPPGNWCGGIDQQGLLLKGLYHLRRSKLAPSSATGSLIEAQSAFLQARSMTAPAGAPLSFWAPRPAPDSVLPEMSSLVEYGLQMVQSCSGLPGSTSLEDKQFKAATAFFAFYRVSC